MLKFITSFLVSTFLFSIAFAEEQKSFKVVALLPLTGALSEYGVAAKNGFELARKEHPEAFKSVELIYDDSKYDNKTALSSYRLYKEKPGVSLFYVWGYGICQALAPVAETDKFPIIAASAEKEISARRNFVLRFNYYHEQISQALLEYLRSQNLKHFAIIKTELAYFNGVLNGMKENLRPDETLEVADVFDIGDMDFKTSIAKLRSRKFDALGVFLVGGQGTQFYRQMDQLKFKINSFGTDFFDSDAVAEEAQGLMDGLVFPTQEATGDFRERYKKAYGNDFQAVWAANSYEFAMLVSKLFGQDSTAVSGDQVVQRFKQAEIHPSGAADYRFNDSVEIPGFDFKVALRKVEGTRVVDFVSHQGR